MLSREGKRAEAEAAFRDALSLYRKLADDHPGVSEIRVRLALTHFQLGGATVAVGQADGGRS